MLNDEYVSVLMLNRKLKRDLQKQFYEQVHFQINWSPENWNYTEKELSLGIFHKFSLDKKQN